MRMDSDTDRMVAREVDGVLTELRTKNKELKEGKEAAEKKVGGLIFFVCLLLFLLFVIASGGDATPKRPW